MATRLNTKTRINKQIEAVKEEPVPSGFNKTEEKLYKALRGQIDKRYFLIKRLVEATVGELKESIDERLEEIESDISDDVDSLDSRVDSLESLKSIVNGVKVTVEEMHNNRFTSFPPPDKSYSPDHMRVLQRIKAASDKGTTKYLADSVVAEEYFQQPKRHMYRWDSDEDAKLERNLIGLVEAAARAHQRKKSAIMFRIAKLLKDAGVEL